MVNTNWVRGMMAMVVLGSAVAALQAGCSSSSCLLEEGCGYSCQTDDDCDGEVDGTAPLCRPDPLDPSENLCTRPCTQSTGCTCACEGSPDEGFCVLTSAGQSVVEQVGRELVCAADKPPLAEMCETMVHAMNGCSVCTIFGPDLDACGTLETTYPSCRAELEALYFCAFRRHNQCDDLAGPEPLACASEIAAAGACTKDDWSHLRLSCG